VIEDIEGATADRPRHLHVLALSAASAAVSLILLIAFVLPPSDGDGLQSAASLAASPSASAFSVTFVRRDTRVTLTELLSRDGTTSLGCFINVDSSSESLVFVRPETPTGRSVPVSIAAPHGWLTVNCATSDVFAPREMFAR
jgi:hypothetical protein